MKETTMTWVSLLVVMVVTVEGKDPECNDCLDHLVSGPRGVKDSQLTASSAYPNDIYFLHDPQFARLYKYYSTRPKIEAWSAAKNHHQYIQVTFSKLKIIKAIMTQGRDNRSNMRQWVTSYSITYSTDGVTWSTVQDNNGAKKIFAGNTDAHTVVTKSLPECVKAKTLRLHPESWNIHVSLRFDVIGCSVLNTDENTGTWNLHPISLSWTDRLLLGQVFQTNTLPTGLPMCALRCLIHPNCLSFSHSQISGSCVGFQQQVYNSDTVASSSLEDKFYIHLACLKNHEYEIRETAHLCYKFYTWRTIAVSALGVCSREKARLLQIHDSNQMTVVQDIITSNLILSRQSNFFIDGSYKNSTWTYSSKKEIPSSLWASANPNPAVGSCVTLTMNGLESHDCDTNLYFVCGV